MQELSGVQSLGWEDPLEQETALQYCMEHSMNLKSLVGYSPRGHKDSDKTERLSTHVGSTATPALVLPLYPQHLVQCWKEI